MNPDNNQPGQNNNPSLPLPSSGGDDSFQIQNSQDDPNPAADLIRRKVDAAYASEPGVKEEILDTLDQAPQAKKTKHQKFIYELTNSGKSLAEIQQSWHEYYAGLPDNEKHQVWQEFYSVHAQASKYAAAQPTLAPKPLEYEETPLSQPKHAPASPKQPSGTAKTFADLRDYALGGVNTRKKLKPMQQFQSLLFGLGVGSAVVLIFLFSFFNERFIAPFIQPSRNVNNTPIITSDVSSSKDPEILIPKINVEIPVVYGVNTIEEPAVDKALESGVVHYADTALPGQNGNVVIVGHSSNNIFNSGKYKFAFVLLSKLDSGDIFYLQKGGKRYTYEVYEKKIVKPTDVDVLSTKDKAATATLITCDPPGTSTNRLVVIGEQISPNPSGNTEQIADNKLATKSAVIPGNAPSLWSRLTKILSL